MPAGWVMAATAVLGLLGSRSDASARSSASRSALDAGRKNTAANKEIAANNLTWERDRFNQLQQLAEQLRLEGKLGNVDAYGNASYFTKDRGFVTDPHPTIKRLMDANLRGQTLDKTVLDRQQRERSDRLSTDQRGENLVAQQNLSKYNRTDQIGVKELTDLLNKQGMAGYNNTLDRQTEKMMTGFARQRNLPASQQWMTNAASATARDFMDLRAANELKALTSVDAINNTRLSNNADQYFKFRDASVAPWNGTFNPASIPLSTQAGVGTQGNALTTSLASQPTPTLDYLQPDFGGAMNILGQGNARSSMYNDLGGLVSALGSSWDTYNTQDRQVGRDLNKLIKGNSNLF